MARTLETLVLRGVSVRRDGQRVNLRLGSYGTEMQAKAIPFSMRHSSVGCRIPPYTAWRFPTKAKAEEAEAPAGIGRSLRRASVLVSRTVTGGPLHSAVRLWTPSGTTAPATVGDGAPSRQPSYRSAHLRAALTRTPCAASTRGIGS